MYYKILLFVLALFFTQYSTQGQQINNLVKDLNTESTIDLMVAVKNGDHPSCKRILKHFENNWKEGYVPLLLDAAYYSTKHNNKSEIISLLEKKTNQKFGYDIYAWLEWLWNKEEQILPFYGDWIARIYKNIDPNFEKYFKNRTNQSLIRLDEVRWGGVLQDGIPPLRRPKMLEGNEANYLADDHIVFGISINGDHRAYPKRILAWHEMFVDRIGGKLITGVYCTLYGTVIAYDSEFEGKIYNLGTSGFLYRSNKLMYDKETQSLWNTIEGKPVIGPLNSLGITLKSYSVVTTTWAKWKELHPKTKVLSLNTGYRRNYNEGIAYQDYFSKDELMFNVPELDTRLKNKEEVLIIRAKDYKEDPLAISANFLSKNTVYQNKIRETNFVVLTDESGGNRVYESKDYSFSKIVDEGIKDVHGVLWKIKEQDLTSSKGEVLKRLPCHRIFWFA